LLKYDYFSVHDKSSFDLFLEASEDVAREHLLPIFTEMDHNEPQLVDGRIRVHPNMRSIMRLMGEGGWILNCRLEYRNYSSGRLFPFRRLIQSHS
jgi:butyryl-CoA dehydrogenase